MFAKLFLGHSYVLTTFLLFSLSAIFVCPIENVDYSYCKPYEFDLIDSEDHVDERGLPLLFMGKTWEKKYYLTIKTLTVDFAYAAFSTCQKFGLTLASVKTVCEYGIVERWFLEHFPTDYSIWIAGIRFGNYMEPKWITTGEPIDLSQFGLDVNDISGPYPPGTHTNIQLNLHCPFYEIPPVGGYSPITYPWANCLSVSRNCTLLTGAPTNPCVQTKSYPEIQFWWEDCRLGLFRVICEEISYSKADLNLNSDENEIGKR